jgi:hypothetical protein
MGRNGIVSDGMNGDDDDAGDAADTDDGADTDCAV